MCRPDLQALHWTTAIFGNPGCEERHSTEENHPAEATPRMKEVELANSVDDLTTSRSFLGEKTRIFDRTEAKYPEFEHEKCQLRGAIRLKEDRFFRGKQISF